MPNNLNDRFAFWFKQHLKCAYPGSKERGTFLPFGKNFWVTESAFGGKKHIEKPKTIGFPHLLELQSSEHPYALFAHAGYGVNSWAFYYTHYTKEDQAIYLRMFFGGVYCDVKRYGKAVITTMKKAEKIRAWVEKQNGDYFIFYNMGVWEIAVSIPGGRKAKLKGFCADAEDPSSDKALVKALWKLLGKKEETLKPRKPGKWGRILEACCEGIEAKDIQLSPNHKDWAEYLEDMAAVFDKGGERQSWLGHSRGGSWIKHNARDYLVIKGIARNGKPHPALISGAVDFLAANHKFLERVTLETYLNKFEVATYQSELIHKVLSIALITFKKQDLLKKWTKPDDLKKVA